MKILSFYIAALLLTLSVPFQAIGQNLKPYTIGAVTSGDIEAVKEMVEEHLAKNDFRILGSYTPVDDSNRRLIVFTSPEILNAIRKVGGLSGFAAAWRVAITNQNDQIVISYTTPMYWGNAYFRQDFDQVKNLYQGYEVKIKKAMAQCGDGGGSGFGSKDGLSISKLQGYKYMMGMPRFDNTKLLKKFDSYSDAVSHVDKNLIKGVDDLEKVYSVEIKDLKLKLYGIGLGGTNGENHFMPKIDIGDHKHTAFLPYEFLIVNNEVHMLHGRYRIALSFPDLTMGRFMKIVSTPPTIKKMLATATL